MNQPREDWQRLADHVRAARRAAGFPTRIALAGATGITDRTIGKLERGERVSADTLSAVATAVGWPPDAPRRILAGAAAWPDPEPGRQRQQPVPAPEPAADDAARIFPGDLAAQDYLRRGMRLGDLGELVEWLEYQRERAARGFPQDRPDDGATG